MGITITAIRQQICWKESLDRWVTNRHSIDRANIILANVSLSYPQKNATHHRCCPQRKQEISSIGERGMHSSKALLYKSLLWTAVMWRHREGKICATFETDFALFYIKAFIFKGQRYWKEVCTFRRHFELYLKSFLCLLKWNRKAKTKKNIRNCFLANAF